LKTVLVDTNKPTRSWKEGRDLNPERVAGGDNSVWEHLLLKTQPKRHRAREGENKKQWLETDLSGAPRLRNQMRKVFQTMEGGEPLQRIYGGVEKIRGRVAEKKKTTNILAQIGRKDKRDIHLAQESHQNSAMKTKKGRKQRSEPELNRPQNRGSNNKTTSAFEPSLKSSIQWHLKVKGRREK